MPVNWKYIFTDLLTYLSNADHNRYRSICTSCAEPHHFYAASATVPGKHFDTSPALDQQKGNLKKKKNRSRNQHEGQGHFFRFFLNITH
jgi:protein-arginine kinase activator protein McsA